ncbi:MAG: methyl-accepting chemotaxis protein [Parvularculaceae bacterium]
MNDVTDIRTNDGVLKALQRSQATIEFTLDGKIIHANENFLNALGYRLEEIVGKHHSMFVDQKEVSTPAYKAFWDKLGRGEFDAGKYKRITKSGDEIWIQAAYNPILDGNEPFKVVKFATDITEQEKAAQEALAKGAAFSGSAAAMMMIDRDFMVTHVNEATLALLKEHADTFRKFWPSFNPDKIIGACIDMFHKNPAHQRQLLSDPSRLPYKTDITIGDLKIQLNVSGIFDAKGKYVGNVLEWADVTATRMNSGMLQALGRSQAIIEFNMDGTIVNANENFCQTLGYSLSEIKGKHHSMFADPAYAASPEYKAFWEKLNRGEFDAAKYRRLGKGGREVWIEATYNPILDGNGKPFKVVKFASDITNIENERKRNEQERARKAAEQETVVKSLAFGLQSLSDGDLTAQIDVTFAEEYEQLRLDFNAAIGKMAEAMRGVVLNADGIRTSAGEISQAADDLSRRTEGQAATLEQTAASLEELTASVKGAAEGADKANDVVREAKRNAEESGEVVREAVSAMSEIEKSSDQISQIIGVIDDIAFQTNLLALNAGVEAARAGDAGRGFAVVASEVRALAQRSSDAAKEIKTLISTSSQHVGRGVDLVGQAGKALHEIVESVTNIAEHVSAIASSAKEQSTGIGEINIAVNQLDQVTQQNAAMVEQSTAASHSMAQEAEELARMVAAFKTDAAISSVTGEVHKAPARKPAPKSAAPAKQTVNQQIKRAAKFATATSGSAALKTNGASEDWEDF